MMCLREGVNSLNVLCSPGRQGYIGHPALGYSEQLKQKNDGIQWKTFLFCSADSGKTHKALSYNGREPCYEMYVIHLVSFPVAVIKYLDTSNIERFVVYQS